MTELFEIVRVSQGVISSSNAFVEVEVNNWESC